MRIGANTSAPPVPQGTYADLEQKVEREFLDDPKVQASRRRLDKARADYEGASSERRTLESSSRFGAGSGVFSPESSAVASREFNAMVELDAAEDAHEDLRTSYRQKFSGLVEDRISTERGASFGRVAIGNSGAKRDCLGRLCCFF